MTGFRSVRWAAAAVLVCAAAGPARADETPTAPRPPEWVIKVSEIAFGDPMKGGSSPLSVSKSRYGWEWLARRHRIATTGTLDREHFHGPRELFDRLDRNGDGVLEAADFDWSEGSEFLRQQAVAKALFNRLDADGNGAVSAEEWQALFNRLAGEKGSLSPDDLRRALFPAPGRPSVVPPTRLGRLFGLLTGELGSVNEGPDPGQSAPDFTLRTQDGQRTIRLSEFRGHKPVVLIFGSFT
jgi:hypothetical protein